MDLVGIKYPLQKENGKFPATVKNVECVQNDVFTLFRTPLRSRVMRPTFGTNINQLVFEPNDSFFPINADRVTKETILFNEPRVKINSVIVAQQENTSLIDIAYSVQGVPDVLRLELESSAEV